jgi:hypothetical protein
MTMLRHYAECLILFIIVLSVVMLNVIMLNVMAPASEYKKISANKQFLLLVLKSFQLGNEE